MTLVKLENIKKTFNKVHAVKGISYNFEEKSQYVIRGASGSGKSTLLYLIGGLERPDGGNIFVQNKDLNKMNDEVLACYRNKFIGFVFQFHFLLSSMNCLDNILLPARIGGVRLKLIERAIRQLADELGVGHCLSRFPYELSGGEQQRISIIRALSLRPKLLLCDEPTGNLDSENTKKVTKTLKRLAEENDSTLIIVTHDQQVAAHFSNEIIIQDGELL